MHRRAGFVFDRLGHEGGKAVVAQRGFADQALEEENLVGQPHRVAMGKVDLDLPGPAFLQDAVDLEALRLGEIVDVVDHLAVFIDRAHRIGLLASRAPPRSPHRRDHRHVGVKVAGSQKKLHLRRDDRLPAFRPVKLDHPAQHVARRGRHRIALLILRVMDDLHRHIRRPRRGGGGAEIGDQQHVGFGEGTGRIVGPLAGDGLQENRVGQEEERLLGKFRGRHGLAARHPGDIANDALNLVKTAAGDVVAGGFGQFIGPVGHGAHFGLHHSRVRV